jgi:hypothetical protein
MGAATKFAVTNQPCRPTSQQDGGPHILVPRRLEYAEDVDASVEAPENLLADEPGHLTVVEAEADQLRPRQDSGLALRPCDCGGRQRFGVMHGVSLRNRVPDRAYLARSVEPVQGACGEIRSCYYVGLFSRVREKRRTKA